MENTTLDTHDRDTSFKPRSWDEMIGQEKLKRKLKLIGDYARRSDSPQDPILLVGPPGTGKSSLAALVAQESNKPFMDVMITPGFKPSILNKYFMDFTGVILLDEIQNLDKKGQSLLYSVTNENRISLDSGKTVPIENDIAIIAATTDPDNLTDALLSRFDILRFERYTDDDMAEIIKVLAKRIGLRCSEKQAKALGIASAESPRQARKLVKMGKRLGSLEPGAVLEMCEITPDGLTVDHMDYMTSLYKLGGTSGLKNLSNHSLRSESEIMGIEKLLVLREFIEVTKSGRVLMVPGMKALKQAKLI